MIQITEAGKVHKTQTIPLRVFNSVIVGAESAPVPQDLKEAAGERGP
ncbi:MAG: hypothetical protein ACAI35_06510 [Candidatus Methylacidiphilales bacterium]